jgi:hypothetical protein
VKQKIQLWVKTNKQTKQNKKKERKKNSIKFFFKIKNHPPLKWWDLWTLKKEVHPTFVFEAIGFCHVYCQYITCVYCCLLKPIFEFEKKIKNQIKIVKLMLSLSLI